MRFRTAREAEEYLLGFVNYEALARYRRTTRTHDLRRFEDRLRRAGWIPGRIPTVHVGGTNGKGTVSHLIERILRAGGERTGLYTSPHLHSMRERVRVDGRPISARDFAQRVSAIADRFGGERGEGFRTTFEHLTALALLHFQETGVDRAVLEVGLGGRLDATNVIPPGIAVLTPISLDHRAVLGRTIGTIAADKAHILKRGGHAILMPQSPAGLRAIERRLGAERIPVTFARDAVRVEPVRVHPLGTAFAVRGRLDYGRVSTRLLGPHQADNVAAAVAVAERVLGPEACRRAVAEGLRGALIPGRLEPRRVGGQSVVLDGGHNPAAARAIASALSLHYPGARIVCLVGMARDKDHRSFLRALAPVVNAFVFTRAGGVRAAPPSMLSDRAPCRGPQATTVRRGLERALATRADVVLVTGSFLVVGEAREALGIR